MAEKMEEKKMEEKKMEEKKEEEIKGIVFSQIRFGVDKVTGILKAKEVKIMAEPVVHHVEICVDDLEMVVEKFAKYGFRPYAKKTSAFCQQIAVKLNSVIFMVTQRSSEYRNSNTWKKSLRDEPLTLLCPRCEDEATCNLEHVDTVFNIALNLKDLNSVANIKTNHKKLIIQDITTIKDESFGELSFAIVKSACDNVVHTLMLMDKYTGSFLPGFEMIEEPQDGSLEISALTKDVSHIDHVTLACYSNDPVVQFYQECFGMEKFQVGPDKKHDDLIMENGVGIKLEAMEYWKCSTQGMVCPCLTANRSPMSLMLVLVETVPDQGNCNVLNFLKAHGPGVEHVALATNDIVASVEKVTKMGVRFRVPPNSYYEELEKMEEIREIPDLPLHKLAEHGILVDREDDDGATAVTPKDKMCVAGPSKEMQSEEKTSQLKFAGENNSSEKSEMKASSSKKKKKSLKKRAVPKAIRKSEEQDQSPHLRKSNEKANASLMSKSVDDDACMKPDQQDQSPHLRKSNEKANASLMSKSVDDDASMNTDQNENSAVIKKSVDDDASMNTDQNENSAVIEKSEDKEQLMSKPVDDDASMKCVDNDASMKCVDNDASMNALQKSAETDSLLQEEKMSEENDSPRQKKRKAVEEDHSYEKKWKPDEEDHSYEKKWKPDEEDHSYEKKWKPDEENL